MELENCEDLNQAIIHFRDTASLLFYRKELEGGLFLDLTAVDDADWKRLHALRVLARESYDFKRRRVRIAPITHFFMGGLVVNVRSETAIPGLFAAGEVVGGFHGANRLGGNALTECIVCGSIAGAASAEHAADSGRTDLKTIAGDEIFPAWAHEKVDGVRPEYGELFDRIKGAAWEYAGVIRNEEGMQNGLKLLSRLEGDLEALAPVSVSEGLKRNRARSALLVLRCVLEASLLRRESRGALYRDDHPEIDDTNWRCNIRISLEGSTDKLILKKTPAGS